MSPFTIFDLINMVQLAGGEPEFVDSTTGGPHLSSTEIENLIDEQTAAVIVTHYHSTNSEIEKIAEICRKNNVKLIEDCAISLGARVNGQHVGGFGDFALFSFGLFKFVSTYFGGGMIVKDPELRQRIEAETSSWPRMTSKDLRPYAIKGLKLSLLTQKTIFNLFTFPVFRFGYVKNIEFIKKNAVNDPDPFLRKDFPEEFERKPSLFQLREFARQIPNVEQSRQKRVANAQRYFKNLKSSNIGGLPDEPVLDRDCYLNFPLVIPGDREHFVAEMMKSGFDCSIYYYRNCAEVDAFKSYHKTLPNLEEFSQQMVFFPVYPGVDPEYIDALCERAKELLA